jgi:orotate phosphoribosyltransferase-like protein
LQTVINLVERELRQTFGTKTEYLTFACLTASTQRKTELRFKDFSEKICKDLNMVNAFPYIKVVEDGVSKRDGGDGCRTVSHDRYFFSGKYVVLFDDVRTSCKTIEQERRILESLGAKVICVVTIAQTTH